MRAHQARLPARSISPPGYLLIGLRLGLILTLLIACVPLHYLWKAFRLPRFWPRMFLGWTGAVAGLRITSNGTPEHDGVLLSNHVSWLDILALAGTTGTAFVAHDGLAAFSLLKTLCDMNDTVFIARDDRASVGGQIDQIHAAIERRGTLTIFPEGTTSDGTGVLPYKSALLSALVPLSGGVTVQPVVLRYEDAANIAWTGAEPGFDNFLRILGRFAPVRLTIHFLPIMDDAELGNRKAMAKSAFDQAHEIFSRPEMA